MTILSERSRDWHEDLDFLQCISSVAELFRKKEGGVEKEEGQRFRVHFKQEAAISVSLPLQPNAN